MNNNMEASENNSLENYELRGNLLKIHTYPDPVLKKIAAPVEPNEFNEELKELCFNMLYTMYNAPGIGLAAPQVGISKRIFVMDIDYDREEKTLPDGETTYELSNFKPMIFINPVISDKEGEIVYQEGCLSLPGVYDDVKRFMKCKVSFQDPEGNHHQIEAEELQSICIQHENDHLDGIVFLERLSMLKRNFYSKKLIKEKKKIQQSI